MTKYYVTAMDDPPVHYVNGYTLKNAKTFARLGTKLRKDGSRSSNRVITRGKHKGPIIRVYQDERRVWPMFADDVNRLKGKDKLTKAEMPSKLIFMINKRYTEPLPVKIVRGKVLPADSNR